MNYKLMLSGVRKKEKKNKKREEDKKNQSIKDWRKENRKEENIRTCTIF